jgi:uncharacterized membrane protein
MSGTPGGYQGGDYPPPGGYQGGGYPPPPPPPQGPGGKTQVLGLDYNVAGMLCYLPPCLCCINLIASILWMATEPKESRFLRVHAMQGLMLFGVNFIVWIIFFFLGAGMSLGTSMATGGSGMAGAGTSLLLLMIRGIIGIVFLIVYIIGAVKAYQGQMWKLPVIGDIAEKNS